MSTHYSCALDPVELSSFADSTADTLIALLETEGIAMSRVFLAYRGLSGIALATALSLSILKKTNVAVGMTCVRKPPDYLNSHGYAIEKSADYGENSYIVFVDDFISSGATLKEIHDKIHKAAYVHINCIVLWKASVDAPDRAWTLCNVVASIPSTMRTLLEGNFLSMDCYDKTMCVVKKVRKNSKLLTSSASNVCKIFGKVEKGTPNTLQTFVLEATYEVLQQQED